MTHDPYDNTTAIDWASFRLEELKYGERQGRLEPVSVVDAVSMLREVLREAGVESMTAEQLHEAVEFYAATFTQLGLPLLFARTIWIDGLMHGILFARGVRGELRDPREGQ